MKGFAQLEVWQRSHELVLMVYEATARFPDRERFRLIDQRRRLAVPDMANVVPLE